MERKVVIPFQCIKAGPRAGQLVYTLVGSLDQLSIPGLEHDLEKNDLRGVKQLFFQCEKLQFISSEGLGFLVRVMKFLLTKDAEFLLTNLQPPIAKILKLTRIDQRIRIIENLPPEAPISGDGK
jgi:anti-anti-sigma factor